MQRCFSPQVHHATNGQDRVRYRIEGGAVKDQTLRGRPNDVWVRRLGWCWFLILILYIIVDVTKYLCE